MNWNYKFAAHTVATIAVSAACIMGVKESLKNNFPDYENQRRMIRQRYELVIDTDSLIGIQRSLETVKKISPETHSEMKKDLDSLIDAEKRTIKAINDKIDDNYILFYEKAIYTAMGIIGAYYIVGAAILGRSLLRNNKIKK